MGVYDAYHAVERARYYGFQAGTTIYFAVDFDALDADVTNNVLPYFDAVHNTLTQISDYNVGIYAPRNVCRRVSQMGFAKYSFVSDMSSGYSGNLGYSLPPNWAFDQIVTTTLGNGQGLIEIDRNVASGRDIGSSTFDPPFIGTDLDTYFDQNMRDDTLNAVQQYLEGIGVPESGGEPWEFDKDWATWGARSNTMAFDYVTTTLDHICTDVARQLGIRKALIQAPVLWELRKYNLLDYVKEQAILNGLDDDSSTGAGQIFAWVAIEARNYCVSQGILNAPLLDANSDRRSVWMSLYFDPIYNIQTAGYLTVYNAYQIGLPKPTLDTPFSDIQNIIARYNGLLTEPAAVQYGIEVSGLYSVLEQYNSILRQQ
jgi:peptidoglycan hydrolase-like protein with peptidoglycan-binding domain